VFFTDHDKIAAMRKLTVPSTLLRLFRVSLLLMAFLVLVAGLAYQVPALQNRIAWRVDRTMTYLRGVIHPAGPMPTALPKPVVFVTHQPSPTPERSSDVATATPAAEFSIEPEATLNSTPPTPLLSPTPTLSPTPIPASIVLLAPKWEKQDINNCGPTTLAMYLRFYGWDGDQKTIADLVKPYREDRNVNVEELAYFTHTQVGWLNFEYRVGGNIEKLKTLIAAGIPVMIEESFRMDESYWPNDDRWAAHYLLITGYNDAAQIFIAQDSFRGANQIVTYTKTDELWQSFNRVYIMIYRPEQTEIIKTILGSDWDVDANRQHALEIAKTETQTEPKIAFAWFNLGTNLVYFDRYSDAADAYDTARELELPQRMLRYQFGPFMAYFHSGRLEDVLALVKYSLLRTNNSEEAFLWQGWALYRQGKTAEAIDNFNKALKANPYYQDAKYALNFVQGGN
jgi:hypothetical protein